MDPIVWHQSRVSPLQNEYRNIEGDAVDFTPADPRTVVS